VTTYSADSLRKCVTAIFEKAGATSANAQIVANHLVESSLAGHDSHGVMRVGQYCLAIDKGDLRPAAGPQTIQRRGSVTMFDGNLVFGQVAGHIAMNLAMDDAREHGIASATVRSCYHSGRIGAYAQQAAEHGLIGLVMVNAGGAGQWVAPFGGVQPRLSTNPIAMGAPGGSYPIVLDFATCMAPEGKIRNYARRGASLPEGWVVDGHGVPSTNAQDLYGPPAGAILPMGGAVGYKGYALAFMVDILAGALSGAGCCSTEEKGPRDGITMIAIDLEHYSGAEYSRQQIATLIDYVKSCPTSPGTDEVFTPGELEFRQAQHRSEHGIPLDDETVDDLQALTARFGLEWDAR
jgi:uncharacterized oxidoreductase